MRIYCTLDSMSYFGNADLGKERRKLDGDGMGLVGETEPRVHPTHEGDNGKRLLLELHVSKRHSSNGEQGAVRRDRRIHLIIEEDDMDGAHVPSLHHDESFQRVAIDGREEKGVECERLLLLVQQERGEGRVERGPLPVYHRWGAVADPFNGFGDAG